MQPSLLILAAGMGSRYGGLKQVDRFGPSGETIIEYSIYDAILAGFGDIVVVIRKEFLNDFKEDILKDAGRKVNLTFVFQDLFNIPGDFTVPADREKPWGTGHAVLSARDAIQAPFAVINADDFYGAESYQIMYDFLSQEYETEVYCIVDYLLDHTLSESGAVSRGICEIDDNGYLTQIIEHKKIEKTGGSIISNTGDGQVIFTGSERVSMNLMGFRPHFMQILEEKFYTFLENDLTTANSEFYLPMVVNEAIASAFAKVKALPTKEKWFGVTYREDKTGVVNNIRNLISLGRYPENLWA